MTEGTETNMAVSSDRESRVDVQDPLPENNFFWRRVYTFIFSLLSVGFIWYGIEALYSAKHYDQVYFITRYMIGVLVLLLTYYMVAPSAEQIVKLIQAAKLLQSGVTTSRRATIQTPEGGRTEVETVAGATQTPPEPRIAPSEAQDEDFAPRSRT